MTIIDILVLCENKAPPGYALKGTSFWELQEIDTGPSIDLNDIKNRRFGKQ